MNAEFNWWLLLVGLVIGAGLAWLVLANLDDRDAGPEETELELEADWIAARFAEQDRDVDAAEIAETLELDRLYRRGAPHLAPSRVRPARTAGEDRSEAPGRSGEAPGGDGAAGGSAVLGQAHASDRVISHGDHTSTERPSAG